MELDNLNTNRGSNNLYRSRTLAVLQKWGVDGEINEFNVRNAASSFARIQVKNQILKWVTIGSIAFLLIFLGLMIASVVIGTDITKDYKVKQQVLVSTSQTSKPLYTSEALYTSELRFDSSLCTVEKVKSLKFNKQNIDGTTLTLEFQVVSFYYSKGRGIIFYGHTHMAKVLPDNSVEIYPITTSNGQKRYDSSKRDTIPSNSTTVTQDSESTTTTQNQPIQISDCDGLQNLDPNGNYVLVSADPDGLSCELNAPLAAFGGTLDGSNIPLNITLNYDGFVGLFTRLLSGANIKNLNLNGNVQGNTVCGFLASYIEDSVTLTVINLHGNLTCNQDKSKSNFVVVGSFGGILVSSGDTNSTSLTSSVTQLTINVITQDPSSTFQGKVFGVRIGNFTLIHTGNLYGVYFIQVKGFNFTTLGYRVSTDDLNLKKKDSTCDICSPCCWADNICGSVFPCNCYAIEYDINSPYVSQLFWNLCVNYPYDQCYDYCCSSFGSGVCYAQFGCPCIGLYKNSCLNCRILNGCWMPPKNRDSTSTTDVYNDPSEVPYMSISSTD